MSCLPGLRVRGARSTHALALFGAAAALGLGVGAEAAQAATAEAELFSNSPSRAARILADSRASAGRALLQFDDAVASRQLTLTNPLTRVVVRARGEQCGGAPKMAINIGSTRLVTRDVTATSYTDYAVNVSRPKGTHTIRVAFLNDSRTSRCDRNLVVDRVTAVEAAPAPAATPTPAPPVVAPTPTPAPPAVAPTPTPAPPVVTPTPTPAPPASQPGSVIFDGDASKGFGSWPTRIHGERISIVDDPVLGAKRKVYKFTVKDSDIGPTENPRAQLEGPYNMKQGGEYWWGYSTMLPGDFPAVLPDNGWVTLQGTYGPPFNNSGPISMRVYNYGGKAEWRYQRNLTYNWQRAWGQPIVRNKWVDHVWHVKLSQDPSVGFVEIYTNEGNGWQQQSLLGQKRLYMKTIDSSNNAGNQNFRIANYRQRYMMDWLTVYHASPKVGTSFAAVAPKSY